MRAKQPLQVLILLLHRILYLLTLTYMHCSGIALDVSIEQGYCRPRIYKMDLLYAQGKPSIEGVLS